MRHFERSIRGQLGYFLAGDFGRHLKLRNIVHCCEIFAPSSRTELYRGHHVMPHRVTKKITVESIDRMSGKTGGNHPATNIRKKIAPRTNGRSDATLIPNSRKDN